MQVHAEQSTQSLLQLLLSFLSILFLETHVTCKSGDLVSTYIYLGLCMCIFGAVRIITSKKFSIQNLYYILNVSIPFSWLFLNASRLGFLLIRCITARPALKHFVIV